MRKGYVSLQSRWYGSAEHHSSSNRVSFEGRRQGADLEDETGIQIATGIRVSELVTDLSRLTELITG